MSIVKKVPFLFGSPSLYTDFLEKRSRTLCIFTVAKAMQIVYTTTNIPNTMQRNSRALGHTKRAVGWCKTVMAGV